MKWLLCCALIISAIFAYASPRPPEGKAARRVSIEKSAGGRDAAFTPQTITCWSGDHLTWANLTNEEHYPGVVNSDGTFVGFFPAPIKPGAVSTVFSPLAAVDKDNKLAPYTIQYICAMHRNEHGTIQVTPTP